MSWLDTPNVPVPGSRDISPSAMNPVGYVQISAATAKSLSPPTGAFIALIQAEADCRWRDDGTAPTASIGMFLAAGATLAYTGNLNTFQIIPVTGTALVDVSFYG